MRKSKVMSALALVLGVFMTMAACGGQESAHTEHVDKDGDGKCDVCGQTVDSSSFEEETYTITFMSNGEVVSSVEAKTGDFVDIPEAPANTDSRITFQGWNGIDAADLAAGKVEVFESDMTFYAIWSERFGTENTFNATRLKVNDEIQVDGVLDEAYQDTAVIPVETLSTGDTETKATVRVMWEDTYLYVFAEVTDGSVHRYQDGVGIMENDAFEIRLDLLHNDSLAEPGYTEGWGGSYRGEPGPMVEGQWFINAGSEHSVDNRFGNGSDAGFEWLSNESKNSGTTFGTSKLTETGYTVEYQIDLSNANVPAEYRPHAGQEIGIGVRVWDKNDAGERSSVVMEAINADMDRGPKKLSNIRLLANDEEEGTPVSVKAVRENFEIAENDTDNILYQDSTSLEIGGNSVKALWKDNKVYLLTTMQEKAEYVQFESSALAAPIKLEPAGDTRVFASAITVGENFALKDTLDLKVTYKNSGEDAASGKFVLQMIANENDNARKVFYASRLGEGEEILVDGKKDAAYGDTAAFDIATIQEGDDTNATGKAFVKWDDSALYVLVEVSDNTVSPHGGENGDSVTLWVNFGAGKKLPNTNTVWGGDDPVTSARPDKGTVNGNDGWKCEGMFRIARNNSMEKMHWLADDEAMWEYAMTTAETGYVVEYRIQWADFGEQVPDKVGAMIDLTVNITDDKNGEAGREGFMMTNAGGIEAYQSWGVSYLDHLFLVDELTEAL